MRPIRVISLTRHSERRSEFLRRNGHVASSFYDAVDGSALTADDIDSSGLFLPEVASTYNAHGYGVAMSHWHLWTEAAAGTEPLTIAEDDASFRHDFAVRSKAVIAGLPPAWDMVLWGWNFDSILSVDALGGASATAMLFDQVQLRKSLDVFQALQTPVQALKLDKAFGLPAYTLSPAGAAKLLRLCFPQRKLAVWVPVLNKHLSNIGLDVATSAVYSQTQSFACFPPLAVTPNVRGQPG